MQLRDKLVAALTVVAICLLPGPSDAVTPDSCPFQLNPTKSTVSWLANLSPGDSIRTVYCWLSRFPGVVMFRGNFKSAVVKAPFDRSLRGADAASLKLGELKEIMASSALTDPNAPKRISITAPIVRVEQIELGKIKFQGALWFLPNTAGTKEAPATTSVSSQSGEVLLVSGLSRVSLSASGEQVAAYSDDLISQLKSQNSAAKIFDLSSFSEADKKELVELERRRNSSRAISALEQGKYKELLAKRDNPETYRKVIITDLKRGITITREANWIGLRYESGPVVQQALLKSVPGLTGSARK